MVSIHFLPDGSLSPRQSVSLIQVTFPYREWGWFNESRACGLPGLPQIIPFYLPSGPEESQMSPPEWLSLTPLGLSYPGFSLGSSTS